MARRRRTALFVAMALVAAIGAGRLISGERTRPAAPSSRSSGAARPARKEALPALSVAPAPTRVRQALSVARPPAAPRPPTSAAPPSLRGTDVDGAVTVDERGDLVVGPELLGLFDYFLSATGEEPAPAIRARVVAAIRERAAGRGAEQAIALFDRYLGYREAAGEARVEQEADPAARLAALRAIRRAWFGEAAAARLFGDEEREIEAAIEESRILADEALSPEERDARIAEVEAALPEAVREAREAATRPLAQQAEEQALRDAGASDEALRAHRVATVGPEAADRLAELDRHRAAWQQRLDAFAGARADIEATVADPDARRAEGEALLDGSFTPEERLRVRAILNLAPRAVTGAPTSIR
ncbi:lipase secretion chaperone [Sorangium sp. So ce764]|uniref:lipase secretion chaperone n=1 Tax=Sorangium sp. So ce764 TaxID=3133320 RepID=UPI003F5F72E3